MKRLLVLFVVIAAGVVLAGLYVPSDAATVGKTSVSRQALDTDLSAIAGSADYSCFLSEERQLSNEKRLPILGAGTPNARGGVYDAAFVDDWLDSMITDQAIAQLDAQHHLSVTSSDLSVGRQLLISRITGVLEQYARDTGSSSPACGGNGETVLANAPNWFTTEQVRAEADQDVLDARDAGAGLSAAAVSAYFDRHRKAFDHYCLAIIIVRTSSVAGKVEAALAGGANFARQAATESITTNSAAAGGSVGCGAIGGTFLATAVARVGVGTVTPPVHSDGYYWIVRVTSRSAETLNSVRSTVRTAIIAAGQHRADAELAKVLRSAKITVDPRFGTISSHRLTLVLGAPSPPAGAEISTAANLPTLTAASS